MLFNSFEFLLFFPLVTLLYFLLPHPARWGLLLVASCVFYMAFIPAYLLILVVTIVIDYYAGLLIERTQDPRHKKTYLVASILATCLVLFVFKYYNFFQDSMAGIAAFCHWQWPIEAVAIILPIGLSFHTFQSLSYVIEVYRGNQRAERHFGIYSLYVMFYPQLVAGPIERPQNLLHQFREVHRFEYTRVCDGLKLMAWGLFKKAVIADRLAVIVNHVYGSPTEHDGPSLIIATVCFAFQIYCDFSGYSDIAIGAAQVMGFRLMENFKQPYASRSIGEFWRRWHISLSTWFKDYLYVPLGGSRVSRWRWQCNLMLTFLVSGLWHGANWTYVVWGALNGFYLVFSLWTEGLRERIVRGVGLTRFPALMTAWSIAVTFTLICFAWIFFRAKDLGDGWYIATHLFSGFAEVFSPGYVRRTIESLGTSKNDVWVAVGAICVLEAVHLLQRRGRVRDQLARLPAWVRWTGYYALIAAIVVYGVFGRNAFIYFEF